MFRRLIPFLCIVLLVVFTCTSYSQNVSAMWNQAKRVKLGLDKRFVVPNVVNGTATTLNPLSPPNTPDVQVFNPSQYWQSENSIGVNFSNSNQLMVSTNGQIPGSNPVVQQTWAFSTDGGTTWPSSMQSESIPPPIVDCYGDPVAFFDRSGRAYFCTLGSPGGIYFVSTTNFGTTWSVRSDADPNSSVDDDKQHASADYSGTYPNNIYAAWTDFGVAGSPVVFNRSTNQGQTWGSRQTLAIGSNRGQGVHTAVGPNGEVYVVWAHYTTGTAEVGVGMAKSNDGGATFNTPAVIFPINGIRISNGGITALNGARAASFPYADVDRSNGSRRGWVYVVVPELDVASTGQADIYFYRSTDGGITWSTRSKVNGADVQTGKWQWMPSIAVDPSTGGVSISYYSMDSVGTNYMTNRYMAYSADGGSTWDNFVVSDVRALWAPQGTPNTNTTYNGDYYETAAMSGKAWPIWTDRRLGSSGTNNRAYIQVVIYSEFFGWVRGTITNLSGGAPLSGVAVDFVENINQQGATSDLSGFYLAGAKVDTPGTTRNVTLRARKFGFRDTLLNITLTRNDTLTRSFSMTPLPGGTLVVRTVRKDSTNIRSGITVAQGGVTRASGYTDSLTGIFSAPLPMGSYDVLVDPPSPFGNRMFTGISITTGTTPLYVVVRAVIESSPAAMRDTLAVGQVHAKTLQLTNTTATDTVAYRLGDDVALARARLGKPVAQPRQVPIVVPERFKGAPDTEHGDSPNGGGGPDAFGYRWVDSDSIGGGVTYNWVEISSVGTPVTSWVGNTDDGYFTSSLPWSFPFYGNSYTNFFFTTNGWLGFNAPSSQYTNVVIPNSSEPNNAIYAWWDDLDAVGTSGDRTVYSYNDAANSRYIVQYNNVRHLSATADTLKFQVILKPNGEILFQYNRMVSPSNLTTATIGIENADGSVGLQVVYNAAYIHNNVAIRFYLPDLPWISENPAFGRINPGATQNITVTFDANGLLSGTTYNGKILLDATHPDVTGTTLIPASLKVNPATTPVIILSRTSIPLPPTEIGTTRRDSLTVRNGGNPALVISSITSTNPRFVPSPTSASINPGDSIRLRITYTAVGPPHSDTGRVFIVSNDPLTPNTFVMLSGSTYGVAHVAVRPDTFFFSRGATPDTSFATIKVFSTGTDTLRYTIDESNTSPTQQARAIERSKTQQSSASAPKGSPDPSPGERDSSGGPDAYGYRWIDSDSPGGPPFTWLDISTIGTQVIDWTRGGGTADDGYTVVPLPWPLSFYGSTYDSLKIVTNGWVGFQTLSTDRSWTNTALPTTAEPNLALYPFWDDLDLQTSGTVHYYNDAANQRFVVQWTSVPHYSSGGPYTFQVQIKSNGQILFQYLGMPDPTNSSTIGVENSDGSIALQVVYSASYVHNNLGVLVSSDLIPWMSTSQTQGTIAPGDSQSVSLRIHPAGLANGLYTGYQRVRGNTPDTTANVRVRLNVIPSGNSVAVTSPNGGETWNVGTTHQILWAKIGAVDTVRIDYSTNGPGGPWNQITSGTSARLPDNHTAVDNPNGTYDWLVPAGAASTNCYIRIAWKSNPAVFDLSDAPFTIHQESSGDTTVVVCHNSGWNLISNPVGRPSNTDSVRTLFPTALNGYVFGFSGGYVQQYVIPHGHGYWAKFPASACDSLTGTLLTRDSISIASGWNIVGSISRTVDTAGIVTVPPGLRASNWFGYTGGYGTVTQLIPGKGYFVKFSGNGLVVLANPTALAPTKVLAGGELRDILNTLTISDSKGGLQTLYFGSDADGKTPLPLYAIPPIPPTGAFDARFETTDGGSMVMTHATNGAEATELPVRVQSDAYPLTVSWRVAKGNATYELTDGVDGEVFHSVRMGGEGSVMIMNNEVSRIVLRVLAGEQMPTAFALHQNYPNPFNPSTTIRYDLPTDSRVSLKVFNIIGQEVVTLVNEDQKAGYKSVVFDAGRMSSGVYFYRLQAGPFSGAKKLMLVR